VIQLVYAPDHAKRRVRVKIQDAIAAPEIRAYGDEQITEGTRGYSVLYDMGEASSRVSSEQVGLVIRHLWTLEASLGHEGPVAIVTKSRKASSSRRARPNVEDYGRALRFFGDLDDAERWLDQQLSS